MNDFIDGFTLKRKTTAEKVVEVMSAFPRGKQFRLGELAMLAGVKPANLCKALDPAVRVGLIVIERRSARQFLYSLPEGELPPMPARESHAMRPRQHPEWRKVQNLQVEHTELHGKLCDLFRSGVNAITGDPMRSLLDAVDAGRKVLAAKSSPHCRFKGAEVERLVARELRQISEAAERAKVNLAQALEVMDTG